MASSKREEERNEKIVRGLMKLPPNRRCINCNSLGPQYVCTNFWTFVCTICSGIHREFTHRVKSVSMSKFTSQEVEALQNGGNQRAREIYLKDWDLQRQRFPNSSDADKVRGFIKAVYVNRKYAGGNNSEKPDAQTERNAVEDTRRASSYHSYSQSPPYDFQYEDRLNRKQGVSSVSRKPGSDRGVYDRKAASFVYSPGRFSDHFSEDRFANEGSSSRVSDYSLSSGGDPFRSDPQSPNLQRDDEFSSPTFYSPKAVPDGLEHQRNNSSSEVFAKKDADKVPLPRPQRTVSTGSFGLFHKNSDALQASPGLATSTDVSAEHHPPAVVTQNKLSATVPDTQLPTHSSSGSNNFVDPAIDLFQAVSSDSQNTYATNSNLKFSEQLEKADDGWATFGMPQHVQPPTTVLNSGVSEAHSNDGWATFAMPQHVQPPVTDLNAGVSEAHSNDQSATFGFPQHVKPPVTDLNAGVSGAHSNDGWATFSVPQHVKSPTTDLQKMGVPLSHVNAGVFEAHSKDGSSVKILDSTSSSNNGSQTEWQFDFQNTTVHEPRPLVTSPWTEDVQNSHISANTPSTQPWNAFGDTNEKQQQHVEVQGTDLQGFVDDTSFPPNLFAEDSMTHGLQKHTSTEGFSFPNLSSHFPPALPFSQPVHPFMNHVADIEQKSSNPFDVAFDSEFESSNAFLDMNSLHAALPIRTPPASYAVGLNDSWFPPNPMGSQGGMSYLAAQPPSSQLQNVPTHGPPAASVGGNPFA